MPKLPEQFEMSAAVDIHTHLREPSPINRAETIEDGTQSGRIGGYIALADMPNNPGNPTHTYEAQQEKVEIIEDDAVIHVASYAGGQPDSDNVGELERMASYSIGYKPYMGPTTGNTNHWTTSDFMDHFKEWDRVARKLPIMVHRGGADLEEIIAVVARQMGHQLHICHVNDPVEVVIIKRAKAENLPVTCGVCPHHLFMTTHDEKTKGSLVDVVPRLARQADSEQLWDMLVCGDIDLIETDHAPHPYENKVAAEESRIDEHAETANCFGIPGIAETMPQLIYQASRGWISRERLEEVTSVVPARVLGIHLSPRTKTVWSNEQYRIEEAPELGRKYVSPYVGNWAVGRVQEMRDKDGIIYRRSSTNNHFTRRVIKPFLTRGGII